MFETHDSSEVHIPSELTVNGMRIWNSVHTRLHVPWLHVVYASKNSDGFLLSQIAFLTYVDQLIQLDHQSDIKIIAVNLVSPEHLNNKGCWEMEPLEEIWIGFEPDIEHLQESEVFVLKNGNRYTYSPLSTEDEDLLEKRLIFRI